MPATPMRYYYNYAVIDRESKMCIEVRTSTTAGEENDSNDVYLIVRIATYDNSYIMKYYDESTGKWYTDAAMTIEWAPPTE